MRGGDGPGAAEEKGMKQSPSEQNGGKGQSDSMKENPWLTFNQSLPRLARVQLSVCGERRGSARCQELLGNAFVTGRAGTGVWGSDLLMALDPSCLGKSLPGRESGDVWEEWAQM